MSSLQLSQSVAVVTGGAGFLGSHLVDALVREGAQVKVVDNLARGDSSNLALAQSRGRLEVITGDIRDAHLWDRVLPGVDVVFHQAALRVNRCEENPEECWEVMVNATRELFKQCVAHRVKKVIAASSAIVYGATDEQPIPETHSLNGNTTWYGTAKIINEQLLNTFFAHDGLPGIALRYFNLYGSRMATKGHTEVLTKWFQALEEGRPIQIIGDGTQTMDWVHAQDVARANLLAAQSPVDHGVFNIGTGVETSLHDLARLVIKSWGHKGDVEFLKSQAPVNPIPRRWADIRSAKTTLGYKPEISLEAGLTEMVQWWREHARVA